MAIDEFAGVDYDAIDGFPAWKKGMDPLTGIDQKGTIDWSERKAPAGSDKGDEADDRAAGNG